MSEFLSKTHLSIFAIPALYITALYPHFQKVFSLKQSGHYDNVHPRETSIAAVSKKGGISPAEAARLGRMRASHINGLENFPLWSIAIISANIFHVDPLKVNNVALSLVISRVFYNYVYINNNDSVAISNIRTLSWTFGVGCSLYLLGLSAINASNV